DDSEGVSEASPSQSLRRPMNPHAPHRWQDDTFVLALRPYYQDTDAGGVVYHTRYIEFAERARNELLRELGHPTTELTRQFGAVFALRSLEAQWRAPARLEELLEIHTRPAAMGGARLVLEQSVRRGGRALADLSLVLVCVRPDTGRAARLPPPLVASIRARWPRLPAPPPSEKGTR
ncbi:MAG: YbgC/FadM family acyl-CoA thioesterase, partial [Alphaproteobacteria bacterium]|nr:YbgC/FadM family acyl-CoA thioesterase [Alphaproteobacteria bacterium]